MYQPQLTPQFERVLTKVRVATSDAVVTYAGPALGLGSLANTSTPLFIVSSKALLLRPSRHLNIWTPKWISASDDLVVPRRVTYNL